MRHTDVIRFFLGKGESINRLNSKVNYCIECVTVYLHESSDALHVCRDAMFLVNDFYVNILSFVYLCHRMETVVFILLRGLDVHTHALI